MSDRSREADEEDDSTLPVWAREDAFPIAGEGYGWLDRKGGRHTCASFEELSNTIREDKDSVVNLVWTPETPHCRVPEEIEALTEPVATVRKRWAEDDRADARHRIKWFGGGVLVFLAYMAYQGWNSLGNFEKANGLNLGLLAELVWVLKVLLSSTSVGIALLGFLIFAFIPWYQAEKRMWEMKKVDGLSVPIIPLLRFETWLDAQKAPVTWLLLGMIGIAFVAQVLSDGAIMSFHESVNRAGLVKPSYRAGEYWRLFTAPMLHGGIVHFVMNMLALLYLGKRVEVFARWPHVPMVFLFAALVGGEASARFTQATSVGASGGLMGWLGFLLVFETLHAKLIPRSAKRRLIGGVIMTGLIGLIGYKFIDNAAHFGGLVAGMAYAAIVFPKSASPLRPRATLPDLVLGGASLVVLALAGVYSVLRMQG